MNLSINFILFIAWVSFMAGLAVSDYCKDQYKKYSMIKRREVK